MKTFCHNYYEHFKHNSILVPLALIFCLTFFMLNGIIASALGSRPKKFTDPDLMTKRIANQVLRLHVIANSDSDFDQTVKLKVKDGLIESMKTFLQDASSKEETISLLTEHQDALKETADQILASYGASYTCEPYIGKATFPVKKYGDIALPAGEYDALCVRLGKAEGKNWWCIVFPNLCFVDSTYSVVPEDSKSKLKYLLTDEDYEAITNESLESSNVTVKFKLWEWFSDLFS